MKNISLICLILNIFLTSSIAFGRTSPIFIACRTVTSGLSADIKIYPASCADQAVISKCKTAPSTSSNLVPIVHFTPHLWTLAPGIFVPLIAGRNKLKAILSYRFPESALLATFIPITCTGHAGYGKS